MLTYFRGRRPTIIGAVLFHGPVRDGKGWYRDAMGTRLKLVVDWGLGQATGLEEVKVGNDCCAYVAH